MKITTIGLDVAKQIFQLHGADAEGRVVFGPCTKRASPANDWQPWTGLVQ